MVRGSRGAITSAWLPPRSAKVASTTIAGRVPPGSSPILAETEVGFTGAPSISTRSDAIANAVSVSRSASAARAGG